MPATFDALVGEERTSEQPAIIRRTAAPAVRMAALFPAAVTDPLRDTPKTLQVVVDRCKDVSRWPVGTAASRAARPLTAVSQTVRTALDLPLQLATRQDLSYGYGG